MLAILHSLVLQASVSERASWEACAETIPWAHAIEVANGEALLGELALGGRLGTWSRDWIRAALEQAPPLDEFLARAQEQQRPLLWYVPTVEGQHVILPHFLDRYVELGMLADPAVTTLLARRFVAIKRPAGGTLARDFELVPPGFVEPGLLVFSPAGELLRRTDRLNTFQPEWMVAFLRGVLRELADEAPPGGAYQEARAALEPTPHDARLALAFATEARAEGEFEAGTAALVGVPEAARSPELALELAHLARAGRAAPEVLAALAALRMKSARPELLLEADALEGLVHLASGEDALAEPLLRRAVGGSTPLRHEAEWALGALLHFSGRDEAARAVWNALAERAPDSLFAARADACATRASDGLEGESPLLRAMQDVRWLPDELYERASTQWSRTPDEQGDIARRALDFLLRQQRADGSWRGTRWGGEGEGEPPVAATAAGEPELGGDGVLWNIHTAISAQAAAAVHAWRAQRPAECARALKHAERFLLADEHVERGPVVIWVYADVLRLLHFARRFPDPATRPAQVSARMADWIAYLVDHQDASDGPFLHYTYTSSFVTACALVCLAEARSAGCEVPERVFTRGADALERARDGEGGLFGYLLDAPGMNRTPTGAASRQALCEWALFHAGRSSEAAVARAVELYLAHFPHAAEAGRKTNFHVPALDFQAGYYFFHNLFLTCLATRDTGATATGLRARLLERVCSLPEIDGSFVDSAFSYGKAYGTAMGLLCLDALR